jgi:putative transcriptional regulator
MQDLKGTFLQSTDALNDTFFEKSVIFITEHDQNGSVGFVINRLFERKLNELVEFKHYSAINIYAGGPVATEHLFFLHTSPFIQGGTQVIGNICSGADFQKAIELLSNGQLSTAEIKIFIGYCGWNSNELEAEIEEGSWKRITASTELLFKDYDDVSWNEGIPS